MRRTALTLLIAAATLLGVAAAPVQAATGKVVVFSTELQPLKVYENPTGCNQVPATAHTLSNETDGTIRVYADPFCTLPASLPLTGAIGELPAGYGTHVTGVGSFRA
ncbi:hypothetical protein ACFYNO_11060 [Kitasatospora sp. NPDC006697]|uniref:hypothetical protein n=1 Tax=Kitasatospora sp. NPDC006697 TaxID=3364020 RepID=UPI0036828173